MSAWLARTEDEACREPCMLTGGHGEGAERCRLWQALLLPGDTGLITIVCSWVLCPGLFEMHQ